MMRCVVLVIVCCLAVSSCWGDEFQTECVKNWHQWRGPRADGLAPQGDPPIHWDEEQNVRWKVAMPGEGHATPIIWGDRVPSPLVYGRHLFLTKSNLAILKVLDPASGETLLESVRLPEMKSIYASPVGAANRVYIVSREGVTLVMKNRPTLDVLGINKLAEGIDASPAIVGRELFLRGQHHLYKIETDS